MRVEGLSAVTSARLVVIGLNATLRTAARALSAPQIGLVVVCADGMEVAGVVTKSDLVRHLAVAGAAEVPVAGLMSQNVISCRPEDDLLSAWQKMASENVENIPVLSSDLRPLGILNVRDALKVLFEQERYEERLLVNYIAGAGYQ